MKLRKYGLIGYPLTYSFSPAYHTENFKKLGIEDAEYKSYPLNDITELPALIDEGLKGLNVTIPYKVKVLPYLDQISDEAQEIGAVNTIDVRDGKLIGYNTDVFGIENTIHRLIGEQCIDNALILGTGGAAKAVAYALQKMGIQYQLVSRRKPYLTYDELDEKVINTHHLIINTTPLGTSPDIDQCPNIPYHLLDERYFIFDLIYNPKKTLFLASAEEKGATIVNGLQMLYDQADKSWQIWNR